MRIVQSYWSKPGIERNGWRLPDLYFISWMYSCLKLRQFYSDVHLVTDSRGKTIFGEILNLPYNSIKTNLDILQDYTPKLWTVGKLYTYSLQEAPFIHVDGDVFIWDRIPLEEEQLIAQHKEYNFVHNKKFLQDLKVKGYKIPYTINWNLNDVCEINAGIIGGCNLKFFQAYYHAAIDFIKSNEELINNIKSKKEETAVNTIMEQFFFYQLAEKQKCKIRFLFDENVTDDYIQFVQFLSIPFETKYIHPIGYHKQNYAYCEYVARLLFCEYPGYFHKYQYNKESLYELFHVKSISNSDVHEFKLFKKELLEKYALQEITQNIRNFVSYNLYCSQNWEFIKSKLVFVINPYVKSIKHYNYSGKKECVLIMPSILSEKELIMIQFQLGVISDFYVSLCEKYGKSESFTLLDIVNCLRIKDKKSLAKISMALKRLLYMNAIIIYKGGNRKARKE